MSYELPVHHDIVFPQFRNANEGAWRPASYLANTIEMNAKRPRFEASRCARRKPFACDYLLMSCSSLQASSLSGRVQQVASQLRRT